MIINYSFDALTTIDYEGCVYKINVRAFDGETDETFATCEVITALFEVAQSETGCHNLLDIDADLYEFTPLFTDDYAVHEDIAEATSIYQLASKFMVVNKLFVPEHHRGEKLSKMLLEDIEQRLVSDFDLLALVVYPLESDAPEATESLAAYYETCGFVRTGIGDIMVRQPHMARPQ